MSYDPIENHKKIESLVVRKKVGGDLKKYYRFRYDRWYEGIVTADCVGCGLSCKFCWVRQNSLLVGKGEGEFLTPQAVAERLLKMAHSKRIKQVRLSGGEPTIGRAHLFALLNALQNKRINFILETNGVLLGEDESYAQELAMYPFVHVRVSLKGCTEEEFALLTGADPKGFQWPLAALRHLKNAGVSVHPAVMVSFSKKENIDLLYSTIWKIDPRMHSEIEREEVILYPHVIEKLRRVNLKYYSGQYPDKMKAS